MIPGIGAGFGIASTPGVLGLVVREHSNIVRDYLGPLETPPVPPARNDQCKIYHCPTFTVCSPCCNSIGVSLDNIISEDLSPKDFSNRNDKVRKHKQYFVILFRSRKEQQLSKWVRETRVFLRMT